jgi:predicted phosphodiesterase
MKGQPFAWRFPNMPSLTASNLVSRRAATVALGGGVLSILCCPARALAAAQSLPNFSFLVVSDTHLGRQDQDAAARQWVRTAEALDTTAGDFVLHLGDVVDSGREAQYAVYRETRKRIRKPVYEIPGNHDPQPLFEKHLRTPVELAFDHKGIRFLLFNNSRPESHDGFVTDKALAWIAKQCADAARKELLLIVCAHVPVHDNKHPDRGWQVRAKDGQGELYKLLAQHRDRVLALFHGHFHNGIRGWDDHAPLQEVVFPSALYNQDRKLAEQKAPGFYLPEMRPGFVQVSMEKGQMRLRYHPVGVKTTAEHVCPLPQLKS